MFMDETAPVKKEAMARYRLLLEELKKDWENRGRNWCVSRMAGVFKVALK